MYWPQPNGSSTGPGAVWPATRWRHRHRTPLLTHSRPCHWLKDHMPPHRLTANRRRPAMPAGSKLRPSLPSARRRATLPRRSKPGSSAGSISTLMTSRAAKPNRRPGSPVSGLLTREGAHSFPSHHTGGSLYVTVSRVTAHPTHHSRPPDAGGGTRVRRCVALGCLPLGTLWG